MTAHPAPELFSTKNKRNKEEMQRRGWLHGDLTVEK